MASQPIGGPSAPVIPFPAVVPPMPAVARILSRYDRAKVEAFVEIAIALLDTLDGDPDREDLDPDREPGGDELDIAWPEWRSAEPGNAGPIMGVTGGAEAGSFGLPTEDDEDGDEDTDIADQPHGTPGIDCRSEPQPD